MIEARLEDFLGAEGMSSDDLIDECRRVKETGDAASVRALCRCRPAWRHCRCAQSCRFVRGAAKRL